MKTIRKKPGRKTNMEGERFCFTMTPEDEAHVNMLIAIVPRVETRAAAVRYALKEIATTEAKNIKAFME